MGLIQIETWVKAPVERCFDLCRSVDVHLVSAEQTSEKAVAGVTTGLMNLNDVVTWEARHFGFKFKMTVKITRFDRPNSFTDSQVSGPFKRFDHTHKFTESGGGTVMEDVFDLECPYGSLGLLADPVVTSHLKKFLIQRNAVIKEIAESERWREILK